MADRETSRPSRSAAWRLPRVARRLPGTVTCGRFASVPATTRRFRKVQDMEPMLALVPGSLLIVMIILAVGLSAYAVYYVFFRLGK